MMKTKIAMTFIDEKKDSASAKDLTLKALIPKITKAKKAAKIQAGTDGNQRCINMAAPKNSVPKATVQQIQ